MPRVHVRQTLVLVTFIYTSMIPVTVALLSGTNTRELEYNTTATKVKNVISNEDSSKIPTCTEKASGSFKVTRCTEFLSMLITSKNLTLGPQDFHEHGLDNVKSIEITNSLNAPYDLTEHESVPFSIPASPSYRGILDMHPDIFQDNFQLDCLRIHQFEHFMDSCFTTENYLFDSQSLTKLILSVSNYKCWSSTSFSRLPNLSHLRIESPNFRIMPGIFAPLHKLDKLEMHYINHLNIVKSTFDGINLKKLILAYSSVTLGNIQVPGLEYLHLAYNSMKHISKDDFIGMPSLKKLIINDGIETIHGNALVHLTKLEYVEFDHTNIISFRENYFRNNFQLNTLLIANNDNLKILPVFKWNNTDNRNHNMRKFKCCNCGLKSIRDGDFNTMPALEKLSLKKNYLKTLPRGFFELLSSLKALDLSQNLISSIPGNMFEGANNLSFLELSENPLTTLIMTPFLRTPKLSTLDLSECQIKVWSETTLPVNSLRYLSLYGNELRYISVEELKTVPNLQELKVLDNPIECDDKLEKFIEWSLLNRVSTEYFVSKKIKCTPNSINNEFCWNEFQTVVCDPNYMSDLELIKQAQRRDRRTSVDVVYSSALTNDIAPHDTTTDTIDIKNISLTHMSLLKSNNRSATPLNTFTLIIVTVIFATIII